MAKLFIIMKFVPGTNLVILLLTGWSKTKFGAFIKAYLAGVFIWFTTMSILAYFIMSEITYLRTERIFKQAEIGIAVIVILVIVGEQFLRKSISKRMLKLDIKEDLLEENEKDEKK